MQPPAPVPPPYADATTPAAGALPTPGTVLLGKYRVDRVIGIGGMGAVVAARHLQLDERVAIKFLLPQMLQHDEVVQRFLREARSAIKIRSEHCVRVLDVGTLETGAPYMVMEFLEGQDLAAIVEKHRPLAIADTIDWVLQAGEALAEAHVLGIVHRDLKPANLFLTHRADGSPSVKVLDFGISKQTASGADAGVTKTQAVLGSPRYMSPEQMRSTRDVDARADVWALGAVVHELVAGEPPFDAETMTALCAAILQDPPRSVRALRPDVPPQLEAAIRGALEKDRDRRFQNVAQLAAALAPFGSPAARVSAERIARVLGIAGGVAMRGPMGPTGTVGAIGPAAFAQGGPLPGPTGAATPFDPHGSNPGFASNPGFGPSPMAATTGRSGSVTSDVGRRPNSGAVAAAVIVGLLLAVGAGTAGLVVYKRHTTAAASSTVEPTAAPSVVASATGEPAPSAVLADPSAAPTAPGPSVETAAAASGSASAQPAGAATAPGGHAPPPWAAPTHRPGGFVPGAPRPPLPAGPAKPAAPGANPFGDDRRG